MITFALFVKMSNGATYAVVPFISRNALGSVSGIVGACGNAAAVAAGFLFKAQGLDWAYRVVHPRRRGHDGFVPNICHLLESRIAT